MEKTYQNNSESKREREIENNEYIIEKLLTVFENNLSVYIEKKGDSEKRFFQNKEKKQQALAVFRNELLKRLNNQGKIILGFDDGRGIYLIEYKKFELRLKNILTKKHGFIKPFAENLDELLSNLIGEIFKKREEVGSPHDKWKSGINEEPADMVMPHNTDALDIPAKHFIPKK